MTARGAFLAVAAFLTVFASGAFAQQKLGDFVTDGGYEWIIGRWVTETDDGKVEMEYKWTLDKSAVLANLKMGGYRQSGIIMLDPDQGQVIQTSADDRGGIWKGSWTEDNGELVYRVENTAADGQVMKADVVHTKVDKDSITIGVYGVDDSGNRSSESWAKATYKRQPATAKVATASEGQGGQSGDYQKLGDLVSEGGYEWMAGKWLAGDEDQKYQLEYSWTLDKHAVLADLKLDDFAYHGMVIYVPARQEIIQVGADNTGGIWRGTWEQGSEGPTNRVKYTRPDGTTREMEHVYVKVANDEFRVKEYPQGSGQPGRTYTFKRQKVAAP